MVYRTHLWGNNVTSTVSQFRAFLGTDGTIEVVYDDSNACLLMSTSGAYLVCNFGRSPSWHSPMEADRPYLFDPETLYWYSRADRWRDRLDLGRNIGGDPVSPVPNRPAVYFANPDTRSYSLLGMGSLVGYGPYGRGAVLLRYNLSPKPPVTTWIELGGYPNWLLILGNKTTVIGDSKTVLQALELSWGITCSSFKLTRYDGDMLHGAVDANSRHVVSYLSDTGSGEEFTGSYNPAASWVSIKLDNGDFWDVPYTCMADRESAIKFIAHHIGSPTSAY